MFDHDPRKHGADCDYHADQYPWECNCVISAQQATMPASAERSDAAQVPGEGSRDEP